MVAKREAPAGASSSAKAMKLSSMSTPGTTPPRSSPELSSTVDEVPEEQIQREEDLGRTAAEFANLCDISGERFQKGKGVASSTGKDSDQIPLRPDYRDFSDLALKPDSHRRPLWIDCERGLIILEKFSPLADQATDFLVTIAEPTSRPSFFHEYTLTFHSLYAAMSVGLRANDIINTLDRFLKTELPSGIQRFIRSCTKTFGKVKLVLNNNKYFVESADLGVLQALLKDEVIGSLRLPGSGHVTTTAKPVARGVVIPGTQNAAGVRQANLAQQSEMKSAEARNGTQDEDSVYAALSEVDDDDTEAVHSFEVPDSAVQAVQQRCLELSYPILEEYDFRHDRVNPDLQIDLRPNTQIRPHQEKSLSKMFGNGRAKSGIIVLPCGAGKTLVGITAACTIKKGSIVLCTSSISAVQWRKEFLKWSNISPDDITLFTSECKGRFPGSTGIVVTTYSMVTNSRSRSREAQQMMDFLQSREWGLMLLDEVHVTPANMFRRVITSLKSHVKLGLTATLLREDDKITELNFLIGPKLYEANWMELSQQGHIAKVQCAEVWCPMPLEFYEAYLESSSHIVKRTLCSVNPHKFQACQYLINYHEGRGDKIIVFSDDIYTLKLYAQTLGRAFIYGGTPQDERLRILENFQHNPRINTLFLSKIGDTSLDLPEATCLIQISSHFGSRRQEAQRLGRILRAKRRNDEGFNAFFYTLVSKETQEMYFSAKRQAFLVDQGYAFKTITHLSRLNETPGLAFTTASERQALLRKTIADKEKGVGEEYEKDLIHLGGDHKWNRRRRTQQNRTTAAGRNEFFRKMERENKRRNGN